MASDAAVGSREQVAQDPMKLSFDQDSKTFSLAHDSGSERVVNKDACVGFRRHESSGCHTFFYVENHGDEGQKADATPPLPSLATVPVHDVSEEHVEGFQTRTQKESQVWSANTIHVIVSTLSGTEKASEAYKQLVKPLLTQFDLQEADDYEVHYTKSPNTITELTKSTFLPHANKGASQLIILLSGDGGLVDIINGLHTAQHSESYTEPMLAIIPMGTGNALAHSSAPSKDSTLGLAALARGHPKTLPIMKVRFSPGARLLVDEGRQEERLDIYENETPVLYGGVVCSWGLHAGLVADSDTAEYRKFGAERFKMAAKEALYPSDGSEPHRYRAKVSLLHRSDDGREEWTAVDRQDHAYVLATMVSNLEHNFVISPDSKSLDGQLRVVHFGHVDGNEFTRLMTLAYQGGKHVQDDFVSYEEIDGVRIEFQGLEKEARWRRICVDGKIVRVEEDGWVEVRKDKEPVLQLLALDS